MNPLLLLIPTKTIPMHPQPIVTRARTGLPVSTRNYKRGRRAFIVAAVAIILFHAIIALVAMAR